MQKKEFNLLDESWIRVVTPSLEPKEVSLVDALVHAHEYQYLSGWLWTFASASVQEVGSIFGGGSEEDGGV